MADKFFEEDEKDEAQEEGEEEQEDVVKVGDMEIKADELKELVDQGKRLKEIEDKQGQPVDDILKSWGKRGERIGEFKKELEEKEEQLKKYEESLQANQAEQLSEEQRQQAKSLVKDLLKDEFLTKQDYENLRAGEQLLSQTKDVLNEAKDEGWPEASEEELLEFMADPANPKDPKKAYKLMFEDELEKIKEKNLSKLKKKGMSTEEGAKENKKPKPKKVTKDNLREVLKDHMRQGME